MSDTIYYQIVDKDECSSMAMVLRDHFTGRVVYMNPVDPGRLIDRAIEYHDAMRTSLTDSEDHRNHAANILRYALDLPLGNVTGQIDDEHWAFIHGVTRRRR